MQDAVSVYRHACFPIGSEWSWRRHSILGWEQRRAKRLTNRRLSRDFWLEPTAVSSEARLCYGRETIHSWPREICLQVVGITSCVRYESFSAICRLVPHRHSYIPLYWRGSTTVIPSLQACLSSEFVSFKPSSSASSNYSVIWWSSLI